MTFKPCPFCGGNSISATETGNSNDERFGYNFGVRVHCTCGVSVQRYSKSNRAGWCTEEFSSVLNRATEAWNTRVNE